MTRMTSLALALATAAAMAVPAAAQQDFRWSGRIAPGQQIQINNVKGDIRAEATSGSEVTVTAHPRGGRRGSVRVEMVRRERGVVICAVYPSSGNRRWNRDDDDDDRGRPRDACDARGMNVDNDDASVDFVVRVPAGVKLAARNVSGDVEIRGLRGPVDARSVSGDVHVASSGEVQASSVSGNVFAALGRIPSEGLEFRSVSGNVTLQLPAGIDADFHARTLSGEIDSDFPLIVGGRGGRDARRGRDDDDDDDRPRRHVRIGHDMRGQLGRGGPALSVTTVSGDVTLRRAR
ncbi:MAG TPA: hypothetical protein VEX86_03545 [Longimicrobium sp.]|nr:hypothetical protein [Longimicrobium sp.]